MSELTRDEIFLRTSLRTMPPTGTGDAPAAPAKLATVVRNLQALGFGLTPPLLKSLSNTSSAALAEWYAETVRILREMVGAHRTFEPMYPNFPRQVAEASDAELLFNALANYFGFHLSDLLDRPDLIVLPEYDKEQRPALDEFHELKWIDVGTEAEFDAIFTRLVGANGSLPAFDRDVLAWFVGNRDIRPLLPESIPQKETLAYLAALLPDPSPIVPLVDTATDVLRVAVAMSEGDVSLAEPTKFRNFSKRERRFLLACLNAADNATEDMLRWGERWKRLGERLHPGDYKRRFPRAWDAFDIVRNDRPFTTFNSAAEYAITICDSREIIGILSKRPGDFARRLDHALRLADDPDSVADAFFRVADRVATPVLLQMWKHFATRDQITSRAFFPKGQAAKVQFSDEPLSAHPDGLADRVASGVRAVLVERFRSLPPLGKTYLDPRLRHVPVPFSQRSASRSLRTIPRGTRLDLPAGDVLRFFVWWRNIDGSDGWKSRVDLDLSASLFGPDWKSLGEIAYYNLRESGCYHSGDITSAPEGACEFVDIGLKAVAKQGARYVVPSVLSYSGQPFLALPECFCGWMSREKPNSGEIFEARTVADKIDLTAESRTAVPAIVDVVERTVTWADLSLKSSAQIHNAAGNSVGFSQIGQAIMTLNKPTLAELFAMHAQARGSIVETEAEAEHAFGLHEGDVTAFDVGVILSEFLA